MEKIEDSFLHHAFMGVLPGMAGNVQTPLKFSSFLISRAYQYCVYPVSKGQAWTLSCLVGFFQAPASYLSRIDIYSAVIKTCCFA